MNLESRDVARNGLCAAPGTAGGEATAKGGGGNRRMSEYMGIYIERKRNREKRRRDSMRSKDQRKTEYANKP